MKVHCEDQLMENEQKIGDLQGHFEDKLSQNDQKIADLIEHFEDQLNHELNGMKTEFQVVLYNISKSLQVFKNSQINFFLAFLMNFCVHSKCKRT